MLTTGNQLRAARALAGIDQGELAQRAGVNINTISAMERRGAEMLTSGLDVVTKVAQALEALGIEFLNHGGPGVRLRKDAGTSKSADRRKSPRKGLRRKPATKAAQEIPAEAGM